MQQLLVAEQLVPAGAFNGDQPGVAVVALRVALVPLDRQHPDTDQRVAQRVLEVEVADHDAEVVVAIWTTILAREMEHRFLATLQRVRRPGQRLPPRVAEAAEGALPAAVHLVAMDHHKFAVPAQRHDARSRCVTAQHAEAQLSTRARL